jgi:hypothetical protein
MNYSKIFKIIKLFPSKHIKIAFSILFLSVFTMLIEIVTVSLIAPLTSSMLTSETFENQNYINKIVFNLFEKSNFENLLIFCLILFAFFL